MTLRPVELDPLATEPRHKMWGCLALLLVALLVAIGPRVRLAMWHVSTDSNAALDEALQWRKGTMALPPGRSAYETVAVGDKRYNVVGYAFVLISVVATALSDAIGTDAGPFWPPLYVLLIALPLPLVAFGALRSVARHSGWAALLAGALIAGTGLRPVLSECQDGALYYINHVLAVVGLLLIGADLLGRQRIWPAVLGLALAVWSRQMTCFYAIPIIWVACRSARRQPTHPPDTTTSSAAKSAPSHAVTLARANTQTPSRVPRLIAIVGVALVAGFPLAINLVKFGDPLDTGYSRMYADRTDKISRDAAEAFWSVRWYPRHLMAMNCTLPTPEIRKNTLYLDNTNREGGSIWLTSPLFLAVFLTAPKWWRDPIARGLMLTTLPVILGFLGYHTTGAQQAGYYRYALDVMPIWLLVIAPHVITPKAAPWTLAAVAWGVLYFYFLLP